MKNRMQDYNIYRSERGEELIGKTDKNTTNFEVKAGGGNKKISFKISCVDKNGEESLKSEIGEWNL
jgi:fibronectin type 3 domain-containing protein